MPEPRPNASASNPSPGPGSSPKGTSSRKRQEQPSQKTPSQASSPGREGAEAQEEALPGRVVSLAAIDRDGMIAVAAYYRSEQRNFLPGFEMEDWLAAEAEIDALLLRSAETDTKSPV